MVHVVKGLFRIIYYIIIYYISQLIYTEFGE